MPQLASAHTEAAVLAACIKMDQSSRKGGERWWSTVVTMSGNSPLTLFADFQMRTVASAVSKIIARDQVLSTYSVEDFLYATDSDENPIADALVSSIGKAPLISSRTELTDAVDVLLRARSDREAADFIGELQTALEQGSIESNEVAARCREFGATGGHGDSDMLSASDIFDTIVDDMRSGSLWSVNTGVADLDRAITWTPEQYTLVSGTSRGAAKAFLVNSAIVALDQGATVVFATHDMSPKQLYAQLLACVSSVPRESVYGYFQGNGDVLDEDQAQRLASAQAWLSEKGDLLKLLFPNQLPQGIMSLPAKLATLVDHENPAPVVVFYDSLQTSYLDMAAESGGKANTFSMSAMASRAARSITRSFGISLVVLAQAKIKDVKGIPEYAGIEGAAASVATDPDYTVIARPNDPDSAATDVVFSVTRPDDDPKKATLWFDGPTSTFTESTIINDEGADINHESQRSSSAPAQQDYRDNDNGSEYLAETIVSETSRGGGRRRGEHLE